MGRRGRTVSTLAIGLLLIGAGGAVSRAALPPPPARRGAEPAEELLSPVDPGWKSHGWHAVVPHAFVLRPLLPVRATPDPKAPILFSLKGGVRVPVVEQGRVWWKVSWTEGRTGWVPAADLEPHAAFVLIDTATGRVIRRMAAKGQEGALSDGSSLWSLSNTGLTRMIPGERPQIWSYPLAGITRDSSLPLSAVWSQDRSRLYVRQWEPAHAPLLVAAPANGSVTTADRSLDAQLVGPITGDRLLVRKNRETTSEFAVWEGGKRRALPGDEVREAVPAPGGTLFVLKGGLLERRSGSLRKIRSAHVPEGANSCCLSSDNRFVAVSSLLPTHKGPPGTDGTRVDIFRADNLARVGTLTMLSHFGDLLTVVRRKDGWTVGFQPDGGPMDFARVDNHGRQLAAWEPSQWALDPRTGTVYLADANGVDVVPADGRRSRKIAYRWRRPLPTWLRPGKSENTDPARRMTSAISLSPDGRTLVLTEWLTNDPEG